MKTIKIECAECRGTGLYSGMGEDERSAVVCGRCEGTGQEEFKYNEFTGRKPKPSVEWVYQVNPGIKIGGLTPERFGGMPVAAWRKGAKFTRGTENRGFTCPAWWYQTADYTRKPDWAECRVNLGGAFSHCPSFKTKSACWARWDKENPDG